MDGPSAVRASTGAANADRRLLGIDEAGRGCVLGPLLVGGFVLLEGDLPKLGEIGVRDSKRLTPRRRQEVYEALGDLGTRVSVSLAPAEVDRAGAEDALIRLLGEGRAVR
ncbi:MAG: hypothetical protein L3K08_05245, partial [Thermoplasmata archaeon]|nr:hypothetical protein [Thermoplasmata archaeon]